MHIISNRLLFEQFCFSKILVEIFPQSCLVLSINFVTVNIRFHFWFEIFTTSVSKTPKPITTILLQLIKSSSLDIERSLDLNKQKHFNIHPVQVPRWPSNFAPGIKTNFKYFSGEIWKIKIHRGQLIFHRGAKQKLC